MTAPYAPYTIQHMIEDLENTASIMSRKRNFLKYVAKHCAKTMSYEEARKLVGICSVVNNLERERIRDFKPHAAYDLLGNVLVRLYHYDADPFKYMPNGSYFSELRKTPFINYALRVREIRNTIIPFLKTLDPNATKLPEQ